MIKHDRTLSSTYKLDSAQLTLNYEDDNAAKLSNLYSEQRGQGHASALMTEVMKIVDEKGLSLWLEVQRYGDPRIGLNNFQLISFYERFGFCLVDDNRRPRWMIREPLLKGE